MIGRLVVAEINLSHFTHNYLSLKRLVSPSVKIMAVVKANAYGHGIVELSRRAASLGAAFLGIVSLGEAIKIRESGNKTPILIMNYSDSPTLQSCLDNDITQNIMEIGLIRELDRLAKKRNKLARVHVKIDTGMHRLGLSPDQALKFIPEIANYPNVQLEGIFSHFATADERDLRFAEEQLTRFRSTLKTLRRKGVTPPLIHMANSAAALRMSDAHFSLIRPGIILYGLPPSNEFQIPFKPKPILTLKTKIVQIRLVHKGETVGYGRDFKAEKDMLIGTLPVGYADGFRRSPKNWGQVLVRGRRSRLLGRVSMDQSSIDLSEIHGVKEEDEVVLIGRQGNDEISAQDVAAKLGTNNYEVVSMLADRVTRLYIS